MNKEAETYLILKYGKFDGSKEYYDRLPSDVVRMVKNRPFGPGSVPYLLQISSIYGEVDSRIEATVMRELIKYHSVKMA